MLQRIHHNLKTGVLPSISPSRLETSNSGDLVAISLILSDILFCHETIPICSAIKGIWIKLHMRSCLGLGLRLRCPLAGRRGGQRLFRRLRPLAGRRHRLISRLRPLLGRRRGQRLLRLLLFHRTLFCLGCFNTKAVYQENLNMQHPRHRSWPGSFRLRLRTPRWSGSPAVSQDGLLVRNHLYLKMGVLPSISNTLC